MNVATEGVSGQVEVPGAPSVAALEAECIERGRAVLRLPGVPEGPADGGASWLSGTEVKGAPSLYGFTEGGALVFNY